MKGTRLHIPLLTRSAIKWECISHDNGQGELLQHWHRNTTEQIFKSYQLPDQVVGSLYWGILGDL